MEIEFITEINKSENYDEAEQAAYENALKFFPESDYSVRLRKAKVHDHESVFIFDCYKTRKTQEVF